jgi:HEAT repeat protein
MLELEPPPMSHNAAIGNAIATLAGAGVSRYPGAIKTLVAACAEPKARQALLSALSTHPRDRTRVAIANQVHKCGAPAVAPLINLMEDDRSAMVRSEAATALGKTRDSRARSALAKAARGEDANLAWAAKNALGRLQ